MSGYNFKSEEDVKEFLKNLHTEYKFGCYGEKKPEVCHLLGDYLESINKDFDEAASIYKKNCDNFDYGRSCAKFGGWKLIGKGCEEDMIEGFKYLKKSCDLNDGIGCMNAGIVAILSSSVHGDNKEAVAANGAKMLSKACLENKSEKACSFLAGMYTKGIANLVEPNSREAYKYALQACELGNPYACMNISRMHELGDGAEKNQKLADSFKLRSQELERERKYYQQTLEFGRGIKP